MTDAEWAVIEPLPPTPGWTAGKGGCPGSYCRRDLIDGIRYLVHNGCVWRALPADLPQWRTVWGGYGGKLVTWAATLRRTLQIVKRPDNLHTFKVLPRRWVVERTFGWIMKHRRCVRDYERLLDHHETS